MQLLKVMRVQNIMITSVVTCRQEPHAYKQGRNMININS
jgi:hypothetical protein